MKRTCHGCGGFDWSRAYSRSYSGALTALRDLHREEFDEIREQLRAELDDEEWVEWQERHAAHGVTTVNR